jgi:serine phosphatase RsbU (regulator of sigma subunit)
MSISGPLNRRTVSWRKTELKKRRAMEQTLLADRNESEQLTGLPHAACLVKASEAASRATYDMERAKEVQARLFPRKRPALKTLNYTGVCIQAGQVGGDYYDFLDLGRGYLGLTVADAAGKGVAAALLMASLQASLRSQCALAIDDVGSLLRAVNRIMCDNMPEATYATLFFAEYSDEGRRLRYVNCGHPPALLARPDGTISRLESTATVLGFQEDWDCSVGEARLSTGDTLLLYTDGVTEAVNENGEEFGECSLAEILRAHHHLPVSLLLRSIINGVQHFAGNEFQDDVTLVVARCEGL